MGIPPSGAARAVRGSPPLCSGRAPLWASLCYSGRTHVGLGGAVPLCSQCSWAGALVCLSLLWSWLRSGSHVLAESRQGEMALASPHPTWRCGAGFGCHVTVPSSPRMAAQPQTGLWLPWSLSPVGSAGCALPSHCILCWSCQASPQRGGTCGWAAVGGTAAWACPLGSQRNGVPICGLALQAPLAPCIPPHHG